LSNAKGVYFVIEHNVKASRSEPIIVAEDLTMAFGDNVIQRDLTFTINRGDVFIVMGASGCGKSTLMKNLIGLQRPAKGNVFYGDTNFWDIDDTEKQRVLRRIGVMYQGGALWSSMTLAENIMLIIQEYLAIDTDQALELASLKLALVGLAGFEQYYPSEISGGMKKRASIARAMALDPEILFLDEPSGGLDPISARMLDDLILQLKSSLGTTVVVITHELASIFTIGNNSVFLDTETKTMIASGNPKKLLEECDNPTVRRFLTRGAAEPLIKTIDLS
jgi:phospholipid/cholesterol/gamma-HCH transport system ATP-binding protein